MNVEDIYKIDPQRVLSVRFGEITDEDGDGNFTIEWKDDSWTDVRILVSEGRGEEWYFTPMSPEGRPYNINFIGHEPKAEDLSWDGGKYVIQFRQVVEGSLLKTAYESEDFVQHLESNGLVFEDLSPLGRVFHKVATSYDEDEVSDQLIDDMLEELCNG